jgi:hypothetical protein
MTTRIICLGVALLGLWSAPEVFAQGAIMDNPQFQAAREMVQASQEAIIREDLRLTASEEADFWPLYEEYRAETLPVRDRYISQVADYMRQYETGILTNEYAKGMIDGYFAVKEDLLSIRKRYVGRFADILPMLKVARFYQLENKMTADVEAELALLVPLVEAY